MDLHYSDLLSFEFTWPNLHIEPIDLRCCDELTSEFKRGYNTWPNLQLEPSGLYCSDELRSKFKEDYKVWPTLQLKEIDLQSSDILRSRFQKGEKSWPTLPLKPIDILNWRNWVWIQKNEMSSDTRPQTNDLYTVGLTSNKAIKPELFCSSKRWT
jgi:hypothetical protein